MTLRDELSIALLACVGSLSRMRPNVRLEVSCLLKLLKTALIWAYQQFELTF